MMVDEKYNEDTGAEESDQIVESPLEDLDPQDLEAIAVIYDNIRVLRRTNNNTSVSKQRTKLNGTDKQLAQDFDNHL